MSNWAARHWSFSERNPVPLDAPVARRQVLRWLTAASVGLTMAPISTSANASQTIKFGLTPVFLTNDLDLLQALQGYLSASTGYEIELVNRRTYQEVTALLVSGQIDAAWICGYPYVRYRDKLALVAVPEWNGRPYYQSYLIVPAEREASRFEDLKGDIHAFSDPDSNSGFLVTRTLLLDRDLDPGVFFRKVMFTYGHRNVIRAVAAGLANSGSVDGYVWEVMKDIEPDLVDRTRPLRKSEWLGFPPVATSRSLAKTEKIRTLTSALLSMKQDAVGRRVLDMLRLTGFGPGEDPVFDGIAEKYDKLKAYL